MAETPKIEIEDLHIAFGDNRVLRGVDLTIERGSSMVIIGGSGTGKSVLLKCILGILQPDRGFIRIDGREITRLSVKQRRRVTSKIGMLFQGAALFDSLSVWENIAFRMLNSEGTSRRRARDRAVECLASVGLAPEVGDLNPAALSGGMQKRVGLARAIATTPDILFFDEPTTGLDPIMADVINDLIVEQVRGLGATALSITHDMASAKKIADCISMLYKGKIIWSGTADQVSDSGNPMVDQFVNGRAEGPIQMDVLRLGGRAQARRG